MQNFFVSGFVGLSVGNGYAIVKDREDDIKQGRNFYLSTLCQFSQLCQWSILVNKINHVLPSHPLTNTIDILCNVVPLLALPATQFWAAVKQGDYPALAERYNSFRFSLLKAPHQLGERSVAALSFLAEHAGEMIRIAMVASSVALIALGQAVYGGAVLAALGYEAMDRMGYVPFKISLFIEAYMPTLSLVGNLIGGTALVRIASAFMLPTNINLALSSWLFHKVDRAIRFVFPLRGPLLEEFDASVEAKKAMSYQEILNIIHSHESAYEVNPAFCSKPVDIKLASDFKFNTFLTLYDQIMESSSYSILEKKIKTDDRFIDFLFKNYPTATKEQLKENIGEYISGLAEGIGLTSEEYLIKWTRNQLQQFVSLLDGTKRVMGLQQDLELAIEDCSKILPYLLSLNPAKKEERIELEDALLKVALEGGDYCGRGIKKVSNEVLRGILQNDVWKNQGQQDTIIDFERKVQQSLQNQRMKIMQKVHIEQAKTLMIPDFISHDTYGFALYQLYFSLGFYPLTSNERYRIGFPEFFFWELYSTFRVEMMKDFGKALDDALQDVMQKKEEGEDPFRTYIREMIDQNSLLTPQERQNILALFNENPQKFHRLLFVRLGVIKG